MWLAQMYLIKWPECIFLFLSTLVYSTFIYAGFQIFIDFSEGELKIWKLSLFRNTVVLPSFEELLMKLLTLMIRNVLWPWWKISKSQKINLNLSAKIQLKECDRIITGLKNSANKAVPLNAGEGGDSSGYKKRSGLVTQSMGNPTSHLIYDFIKHFHDRFLSLITSLTLIYSITFMLMIPFRVNMTIGVGVPEGLPTVRSISVSQPVPKFPWPLFLYFLPRGLCVHLSHWL